MRKRDFPVDDVRRFLEPGPIVLVSSAWKGKTNIMTMGWHMVMGESPSLVGCFIWDQNHSFEMIRKSRECVINVPTVDLAKTVVGIGNTSGADIDKFADLRADGRSGQEGERAADRGVPRELRVPARGLQPDQPLQPVRVRGGEGLRANDAEVSEDAALPRRRSLHDRRPYRQTVSQGLQGRDAPGLSGA